MDETQDKKLPTLIRAVVTGELDLVKQALKEPDADINVRDASENGALHYAVNLEETSIIEYLLKQTNINVNIQDGNGNTPLHLAYQNSFSDIIKALLLAGADLTIENNFRKTPKKCDPETIEREEYVTVYGGPPSDSDREELFIAVYGGPPRTRKCCRIL